MNQNFLLGNGEKLTNPITLPHSGGSKNHPYSVDEAKVRLSHQLQSTLQDINLLPSNACPRDEVVASITLHPAYLSKSYYPDSLLREVNLKTIGSKAAKITPEKVTNKNKNGLSVTSTLFVSGTKKAFQEWANSISSCNKTSVLDDLRKIEMIKPFSSQDKIKQIKDTNEYMPFEVVLHASALEQDIYILKAFSDFAHSLGAVPDFNRRRHVGGLCFLPMIATKGIIVELSKFSYLRVVRSMPEIRPITPSILRSKELVEKIQIPTDDAIDPNIKVAVFDGGIPENSIFSKWVKSLKTETLGNHVDSFINHGTNVTSALLFGSIDIDQGINRPFSNISHFRVLDDKVKQSDLFEVLDRIMKVLINDDYEFINISLGPDLPIDDDDVHVWTATLDEYLSTGRVLATVAAGNTGDADDVMGLNRIQPPSDCVNVLSVGACDTLDSNWKRASYSSIGPGRSPGFIKPDGLAFGGCPEKPFYVLKQNQTLQPVMGTSFAAPYVLRTAIGARAILGNVLKPLALKALLIHQTESSKDSVIETGWGRFQHDLNNILTCDDCEATVIYQGTIEQGKYLRAPIPFPTTSPSCKISIKATFCFSAQIDAEHPVNYTRNGLEVYFRPNKDNMNESGSLQKSSTFFSSSSLYKTEQELRDDCHKWETCLHKQKNFNPGTLFDPSFDIKFHAREEGHNPSFSNSKLPYALIVTVRAPNFPDLYNQIVRRYRVLQQLRPQVQVPIRIG